MNDNRAPKIGECPDYGGMICRRYYPGENACQQFGGRQKCLLDLREAAMQEAAERADNGRNTGGKSYR